MTDYDVSPPPDRLADRVQLRTAFSTDHGQVVRFLIQLEYWLDGKWRVVVRYDHDQTASGGHDVTLDGLHRDEYRDGEKYRTVDVTGPIPAERAFEYAEDDLRDNVQRFVERFERWHDVTDGNDL